MVHANPRLPPDLDVRDPNFSRDMLLWAFQTQCEMNHLILASKATIAATRIMIAEADRILGGKWLGAADGVSPPPYF
jgi:hypothetical protein